MALCAGETSPLGEVYDNASSVQIERACAALYPKHQAILLDVVHLPHVVQESEFGFSWPAQIIKANSVTTHQNSKHLKPSATFIAIHSISVSEKKLV